MTTLARADVQTRLAELAYAHAVPGASFALLADDRVTVAATGVLSLDTGVEATPDAVFQLGSIGKSYTATVIVRLAEQGKLDLDAPVRDVLPDFKVADPNVTEHVTPRHLLTHTSGIAGECFADTGRGDDCLKLYVEQCADLGQDVPLGATMSYCNTGYCILGRIIEVLTGQVWDTAMREQLLDPLGLTRTVTLPENVARYRYAWGHDSDPGERPAAVPMWDDARALGPAGSICASAADVLAFARLHLDGGVAPDGTRLLSEDSVREMQRIHVDVPEPWATGPHWGLGWIRHQYEGRQLFGHDGNVLGQNAYLLAVPDRDVAITLLTNVSSAHELSVEVYGELLSELCGIDVPPWPSPAENGAAAEAPPEVMGSYQRYGIRIDIERAAKALTATAQIVEPLASQFPIKQDPVTFDLRPSTEGADVFVARRPGDPTWMPVVFFKVDGDRYVHMGARAQRQVEVTPS